MAERTYTDEQVREIMRRAVERGTTRTGGLGREDLIAAAQDVGIAPEAVDAAIAEVESEGELGEELAQLKRERQRGLASSISTWAIVNTGLFGVDWATGGGWWFHFPLICWGIPLLLGLKGHLFANETADRRAAERRVVQKRRKREAAQAELRRLQERARRQDSSGLEGVIERGVEELLGAAARRISGVRVEDGAEEQAAPGTQERSGSRRRR
jgi:2TM domain